MRMLFLLMGAVTNASISPSFRSCVARSRAAKAASPAAEVDLPKSTFTSSPQQLIILMRFSLASAGLLIRFRLMFTLVNLR